MTDAVSQRLSEIDTKASGWCIGGVRILVGLMWLANLHWKVPPNFGQDTGGGLYKYADSVTRHSTLAPYTWVTEHVILPNFSLFGWITLVVETALALLLLAGYRTKIVALVAAAWAIPIFLSVIYYDKSAEWSWAYLLMIGIHLLLYATDAGRHFGLDGVLAAGRRGQRGAQRWALQITGVVAMVVGVCGLFVARSIGFTGRTVALLGSDAGFVNDNGSITRRWELKFVFFNPLWAILTIVFGAAVFLGARKAWAAYAGAGGFAIMAIVVFATETFDYARDDGAVQVISTAPNTAVWGAFALVAAMIGYRLMSRSPDAIDPEPR